MRGQYIRYSIGAIVISLGLYLLLSNIALYKGVFSFMPSGNYDPDVIRESEWQKRNIAAMNLSYDELMMMGKDLVEEQRLEEAIEYFYYAKSLFPYRIEPRMQISYLYMSLCSEDQMSYCAYAKKELYYAMKYVDPAAVEEKVYLQELVYVAQIEDILPLPEDQALAAIF